MPLLSGATLALPICPQEQEPSQPLPFPSVTFVVLNYFVPSLLTLRPLWQSRGGSHIDMVYVYVPAFWGTFFAKFGIAIRGFSSETKEPKLHKLGVFWANYCKKHPIWSKLGAFLSKMVYWWVGNLANNWCRDSQIFEVRQAHPRTILVKDPPRLAVFLCTLLLSDVICTIQIYSSSSSSSSSSPVVSANLICLSIIALCTSPCFSVLSTCFKIQTLINILESIIKMH